MLTVIIVAARNLMLEFQPQLRTAQYNLLEKVSFSFIYFYLLFLLLNNEFLIKKLFIHLNTNKKLCPQYAI